MPCSACGQSKISYPATPPKTVTTATEKPAEVKTNQTTTGKRFPPKVVKELPPIR